MPDGFTSDGCTGFPDAWRGIDLLPCCEAHDLAWLSHPGDWSAFITSNVDLGVCFYQAGVWELAIPAKGMLPHPITEMTLEELLAEQLRWVGKWKLWCRMAW